VAQEETLEVRIRAILDGVDQQLNAVRRGINGLGQEAEATGGRMDGAARRMQYFNQAAKDMGRGMLIAGGAIAGAIGLAIKEWTEFSGNLAEFQSVTGAQKTELDALGKKSMDLAEQFGMSATDIVGASTALAKAGVTTADILNGALAGALELAAADGMSLADAADIASVAMTQFGKSGADVPHIADLLASGAADAVGSVHDLGLGLKQSGLVANQFGISIEETVGTLSAFAAAGLIGSDAGTSFKQMLLQVATPSHIAQQKMDELGISLYDAKGNFIGLSGMAGVLQDKLGGLDQKSRTAALGIIFGTDAIRSATVLYQLGAKGVDEWTQKVNVAGSAQQMAAKRLDSLSGDLNKLKATFQNSLIQMGEQSDSFVRPLVQGLTSVLRQFNSLDEGTKGSLLQLAGLTSGALLLGGAFFTITPKVFDTIQAFKTMSQASPNLVTALGRIGLAAGVAAGAIAGLRIINTVFTQKSVTSVEDMANAMMKFSQTGAYNDLNGLFTSWDSAFGDRGPGSRIKDLASAVHAIIDPALPEWMQNVADGLNSMTGSAKSDLGQVKDRFSQIGQTMGSMVASGDLKTAQNTFRAIAQEFERQGKGASDALQYVPAYSDALLKVAHDAGVVLQPQDLLNFALGKMPAGLAAAQMAQGGATEAQKAAVQATQDQLKALQDLGLGILGDVEDLDKFTQGLLKASGQHLSTRDTARQLEQAMDDVTKSITENGTTLDIHTEKGRNNQAALDGIAKAGFEHVQAMASERDEMGKNVYSQEQVTGALQETHDKLIAAAAKFGITGKAAEDLARDIMNVPPGVDINSWMSDYAKKMAEQTQGAINNIQKQVDVTVTTYRQDVILATRQSGDTATANAMQTANDYANGNMYRKASGGAVYGPGPKGIDSVPHLLAPGEHVLSDKDVDALGGQQAVYALRAAIRSGASRAEVTNMAVSSSAASKSAGGPSTFQGKLYLDSGEFIGYVKGVAEAVVEEADRDFSRRRIGV
jgi:TP901 family phage tail tape measure protein